MKLIQPILIIGGGHMGGAMAMRWHTEQLGTIHVVEPNDARRRELTRKGLTCHAALADAPKNFSAILLAVKPQQFAGLVDALRALAIQSHDTLFLSIIAGIPLASVQRISPHAVRLMPNLPAMVGESMSVAYGPTLDALHKKIVTHLFDAVGQLAWVEDEQLLHAATAISGSGPGYLFAFMDALEKAAIAQGLSPELARQLICQTVRGTAALAKHSTARFVTLQQNVTSPSGTTEAALNVFDKHDLSAMVGEAVNAAAHRSKELSQ